MLWYTAILIVTIYTCIHDPCSCRFKWFCNTQLNLKAIEQTLQTKGLDDEWIFMCLLNKLGVWNRLPHSEHGWLELWSEWNIIMWCPWPSRDLKYLGQISHIATYPWYTRKCFILFIGSTDFPQTLQTLLKNMSAGCEEVCSARAWQVTICSVTWFRVSKYFKHTLHCSTNPWKSLRWMSMQKFSTKAPHTLQVSLDIETSEWSIKKNKQIVNKVMYDNGLSSYNVLCVCECDNTKYHWGWSLPFSCTDIWPLSCLFQLSLNLNVL